MLEGVLLAKAEDALLSLEDVVLTKMWNGSSISDWGPTGCAFNLRYFDPLPREVVRGVLRNLRNNGMVEHARGLWDENGEPRGAGYALTQKAASKMEKQAKVLEELTGVYNG